MTQPAGAGLAPAGAREGPINPLLAGREEYPFVTLQRMGEALVPPGLRMINFGIGDPREETPPFIRETVRAAVPAVSSYPDPAGQPELRQACARWLGRRYGVSVDPERHVTPANGTKEAIFLLALVVVGRDPHEARRTVVIPTPSYPVYPAGARFAGADIYFTPLKSEDGWRFNPERVPEEVWARTALLWLNSPHNPTGATLSVEALAGVARVARRFGFWVASDEAYAEIYFDQAPASMLQCGLENVVVFHTLSKRSAMTGYRSGFMAGDERLIAPLRRFRPNAGVATPDFVQRAAIAAWNDDAHPGELRARYAAKRRLFLDLFARRGWKTEASEASFYLWWKAPGGEDLAFVKRLLGLGLVAMPGSFMGQGGEGFVRLALVPTLEECREAVRRLESLQEGAR